MQMPVFRVEKNGNYTTMSNHHLRDPCLSLKAKGLLSMCLSLTESWDYSINGLAAISKEGRGAVLSAVQELEKAGYISREQSRSPDGKMGHSEYVIREIPVATGQSQKPTSGKPLTEKPTTENPATVSPMLDHPAAENPPQLSTDLLSTEEKNNRLKKEPCHRYGRYENVLLSDGDLEKLKAEFPLDYRQRIERLSEYMASSGKSYKSHLATIRCWAAKDKPAEPPRKKYGDPGYYDFKEGDSL